MQIIIWLLSIIYLSPLFITLNYFGYVLCGSIDGRGVWGRVDMCICMAESFHCPPETVTILLICYSSTHTHTHTHTHTQTVIPVQGVSVQTLDGELRSHVPHSKSIDQQKIIKEKSDGDP